MPFYTSFFDPVFQNFHAVGRYFNKEITISDDLGNLRYSYKIELTPKEGGEMLIE